MSIDQDIFQNHINAGSFQDGVSRGKWRLIETKWPYILIAVTAASRNNAPNVYVFRFDCANYPQDAPTARLWDVKTNLPLEPNFWPTGTGVIPEVFKEWGRQSIYLPCDRTPLMDHHNWPNQHRKLLWNPRKEITHYLGLLYGYLNSVHYKGSRSSVGGN